MSLETVVNTLLGRLEQVAARLEKIEKQISTGGAPAGGAGAGADASASVAAFDAIVDEHLTGYYAKSEEIGGAVAQQATAFKALVAAHRRILETAAASKKPSDADFAKIAAAQGEAGQAVQKLTDNRSPLFPNLSTVSEAVASFMWIAMAPTPVPYINETIGSSEYHSNKIRRDQKGKDEKQIEWVNHFNGFLKALSAYVKQHHTTGLTWNAKGGDALSFGGGAAAPAPAAAAPSAGGPPPPAGGPPPPGPPPPASAATDSSSSSADAADMSGVFAQLNRGGDVTTGLRKVTADMKSKNRTDRSGKVEEKAPAEKAPGRLGVRAPAVPNQPPKLELQGNKWVVEYQTSPVTITITEKKQTVYIYKCTGATVQIQGKLNAITIDSCKKTNVIFDEAISSCEVVNCNGVKVQVVVKVPAVTIDKTSGGVVYLSNEGLDTQIFTSKSDELNVCIPGPSEEVPLLEFPVPEQFLNTIRGGKLHTEMNTHLGE
jgi:adenylyl cyclase-associated protein